MRVGARRDAWPRGGRVAEGFTILTVCTGNICRSPLAERLLANALADLPQVRVSSAGTHAVVGHAMDEAAQLVALRLGVSDPGRHVARQLTAAMLAESDLVLALSRDNRRFIVELNPRVARRVFTLREFGRLASATTDDDLRAEIAPDPVTLTDRLKIAAASVVLARTELSLLTTPEDDDVIDPIGGGPEVLDRSTEQLLPAIAGTVGLFRRVCEL